MAKAHTSDGKPRSNNPVGLELRTIVERIERLEEEKKTIADDIKDVYGEAKGLGYDTKIIKKIISERKRDAEEVQEEELILETYRQALGMLFRAPDDEDGEGAGMV